MQVDFIPRDKLLPFRGTLSINKSKKLINYKLKFNLERGNNNYLNWYLKKQENNNAKKYIIKKINLTKIFKKIKYKHYEA